MKNARGIFKKTFQNLLTNFDVSFVLDAFVFYCFLHTLFQSQIESNIQRLM